MPQEMTSLSQPAPDPGWTAPGKTDSGSLPYGEVQQGSRLVRLREWLVRPVDGASVAVFRILFGLLMFWEVLRYFRSGYIRSFYMEPIFHFTYPLFDFVK